MFWHVWSVLKYLLTRIRCFLRNWKIFFRCRDIQFLSFGNTRVCIGNSNFKLIFWKITKKLITFHKIALGTSNLAKLYNIRMPRSALFAISEFFIFWSNGQNCAILLVIAQYRTKIWKIQKSQIMQPCAFLCCTTWQNLKSLALFCEKL